VTRVAARRRAGEGGSRFLYEPFEFASIHQVEAHERIVETKLGGMGNQLERLEEAIERLERRLWTCVYGVAAVVLTEIGRAYLDFGLGG
jgi:hypothetical protein